MSRHLTLSSFAILLPVLVFGCSRSSSDVGRIKDLEERHVKLEKEHQTALTEAKKVSARLTRADASSPERLAESKKLSTERDDLHAELKKTTRDRDELGKALSARTEELVSRTKELVATIQDLKTRTRERDDLKIDLSTRTKERDVAYQDLHQFTAEMQSLVARMEASLADRTRRRRRQLARASIRRRRCRRRRSPLRTCRLRRWRLRARCRRRPSGRRCRDWWLAPRRSRRRGQDAHPRSQSCPRRPAPWRLTATKTPPPHPPKCEYDR